MENKILSGEDNFLNQEKMQDENSVAQDQHWWEAAMFLEPAHDSER